MRFLLNYLQKSGKGEKENLLCDGRNIRSSEYLQEMNYPKFV